MKRTSVLPVESRADPRRSGPLAHSTRWQRATGRDGGRWHPRWTHRVPPARDRRSLRLRRSPPDADASGLHAAGRRYRVDHGLADDGEGFYSDRGYIPQERTRDLLKDRLRAFRLWTKTL